MAGRPGAVLQDRQADRAEVPGALRPRPRACAHTPSGSVQRFSSGTLGDSDTLCWYQKRQAGRPRLPPSFRLPHPDRLLLRGAGLCRRCQLGQPSVPSRRVSPVVTSPRLRAQQGVASPPHPRARRGVRRPPRGLEQVLPLLRRWGPRPRQGPGPAAAWAPLAPRAWGAPDFASALRVPRTDFFL